MKHVHQTTHACVAAASCHSLSLLTAQHVSDAMLENLVLLPESAQIATQVGTRIQQEVSNARNALAVFLKSREEQPSAVHASWALSPTTHRTSSATTAQKDTTRTAVGAQAASCAFLVPFKMNQKNDFA